MRPMCARIVAAALLCLATAVPSFAASRFGEIVEAFGSLHPGAAAPVSNATFSAGHLKLTLRSGSAAPVMANRKLVAIFFKGDGTLDYDAAEPIELPVVNHKIEGDSVKAHVSGPVSEAGSIRSSATTSS